MSFTSTSTHHHSNLPFCGPTPSPGHRNKSSMRAGRTHDWATCRGPWCCFWTVLWLNRQHPATDILALHTSHKGPEKPECSRPEGQSWRDPGQPVSAPSRAPFWGDSGGPTAAPRLVRGSSSQGHLVGVTLGVYEGTGPAPAQEARQSSLLRLGGGGRSAVSPLPRVPTAALDKLPRSDAELTHHARHTRAAHWGD